MNSRTITTILLAAVAAMIVAATLASATPAQAGVWGSIKSFFSSWGSGPSNTSDKSSGVAFWSNQQKKYDDMLIAGKITPSMHDKLSKNAGKRAKAAAAEENGGWTPGCNSTKCQ